MRLVVEGPNHCETNAAEDKHRRYRTQHRHNRGPTIASRHNAGGEHNESDADVHQRVAECLSLDEASREEPKVDAENGDTSTEHEGSAVERDEALVSRAVQGLAALLVR